MYRLFNVIYLISDVVYDKTVIPSLVSVLKCLLCSEAKRRPCAYIASTIRNEDTRDQFLICLCKYMTLNIPFFRIIGPDEGISTKKMFSYFTMYTYVVGTH